MKTFNIIACIIVLLLALVSAVFSYFLYEKRVQFVEGWQMMSTAIHQSATTIDKQSDQKFAPKLTQEQLSHKNYDQATLQAALNNLQTQSRLFVEKYEHAIAAWEAMTAAIQASAKIMDEKLGTTAAETTLTPEALVFNNTDFAIENYQAKFAQLVTLTQNFATTYNTGWEAMSETLRSNAAVLSDISPAPEVDFATQNFDAARFQEQMAALARQSAEVARKYADLQRQLAETRQKLATRERELADMTARYNNEQRVRRQAEADRDLYKRQRDVMAEGLAQIGKKTGAGRGHEATSDFTGRDTYGPRVRKVVSQVAHVVDNREAIGNQLVALARANGETLNKQALFAASAQQLPSAIAPLVRVIEKQRKARQVYANALSRIGGWLGVQFRDDLTKPETNPAPVVSKADAKVKESEQRRQQLVAAAEAKRQDEATISRHEATIRRHEATINELRRTLQLDESEDAAKVKNWEPGSKESRQALVGTVTKVSPEFGYIVIDFGRETVVYQQIGNRSIPVNPHLTDGLKFNITRGENEFIATITLNNFGDTESTADIPPSKVGMIQVGDKVTFTE